MRVESDKLKLDAGHNAWRDEEDFPVICREAIAKRYYVRPTDTIVLVVSDKPVKSAIHKPIDEPGLFSVAWFMLHQLGDPPNVWWWVEIVQE